MAESSKNSNHCLYQPKLLLLSFYTSESCPLSEYIVKVFNLEGLILAYVQQFSRLLDKFEVWISCEAVCDIFDQFSVLLFKVEFNSLPDLLNTGFTIIEIGLF